MAATGRRRRRDLRVDLNGFIDLAVVVDVWSPHLAGPNGNAFPLANVLNGFGFTGANVSPALKWRNLPVGTRSLALQVHDREAPTGAGFWHWAVYDIPPTAMGLARGAGNHAAWLPAGAYGGNTDFMDTGATGENGHYGGPCPPTGDAQCRSNQGAPGTDGQDFADVEVPPTNANGWQVPKYCGHASRATPNDRFQRRIQPVNATV